MIVSKSARLFVLLIVALVGGYAVALLAVPFLGFGWHLLHGNFIAFNGYRIPVPREFYVDGNTHQPTMWKHTLGVPLFKAPFGMIGVRPRPSDGNFDIGNDLENSSARMIATARNEGLNLRSRQTLPSGTGDAFCFEFSEPKEKSGITVRCVIDHTPILMIYGGNEVFSPDFYSAVRGISREEAEGR